MLSEQMITAANRAQAAIAVEPRPIELAAVGMDLVRKVRAYAEMAAALEIQIERLSYRLHQAVMAMEEKTQAREGEEVTLSRLREVESLYRLIGDPAERVCVPTEPSSRSAARDNVAKFRRPDGDFLRVFQGGAIRG